MMISVSGAQAFAAGVVSFEDPQNRLGGMAMAVEWQQRRISGLLKGVFFRNLSRKDGSHDMPVNDYKKGGSPPPASL